MKKRILSMLLAIVMVLGLMPGFAVTASAASDAASVTANGTTTGYPTVEAALHAVATSASADTVLKLLSNVGEKIIGVEIKAGTFTLDLNGYNIMGYGPGVSVSGGNVTIVDSSEDKKGTIKADVKGGVTGVLVSGGSCTIEGGTVSGYEFGVSVEGGSCTITDSAVISGTMGSVSLETGTLVISGGTVSCNRPSRHGVVVAGGSCTISGGEITATSHGVILHGGSLSVTDGEITGGAYGVCINEGDAVISGGTISGANVGVYLQSGKATVQGGAISGGIVGVSFRTGEVNICGGVIRGAYNAVDFDGANRTADVSISGGSFSHEPDYTMYADVKYVPVWDAKNGLYTVVDSNTLPSDGAAEVNGIAYVHLSDALSAVASSTSTTTVLKLLADVTEQIGINSGVFTLDLNGRSVNVSSASTAVTLKGGNIVITDSSESKTGTIKSAYIGLDIGGGAVCEIRGGHIEGNSEAVAVDEGGELSITGGSFSHDPSEWVVEGYAATQQGNMWVVAEKKITVYPLWLGGKQVTSERLTVSDGNGGTATYDPTTNTLTLSNYTYEGAGLNRGNINAAICYLGRDTLNLVLKGSNTVTQTGSAVSNNNFGVLVYGALTVSGSGTLTVIGGQANATAGVYAEGDITVSGGTIAAAGGQAGARSCGVYANGAITVSGTGTLTGTGGSATGYSFGVYAGGAITVSDAGTLTGTGGLATGNSFGVYPDGAIAVSGGELIAEGSTRALGKAPVIADTHAVYGKDGKVIANPDHSTMTYARIALKTVAEVNGTPYLTIEDALSAVASSTTTDTVLKLLADVEDAISIGGGTFTLDLNGHSITGSSYGLYISAGDITVTDSLTGGTITSNNYGVYVDGGSVSIIDGTFNGAYGVYSNNGEVTISGGNIMGNDIGVCTSMNSTLTITGGTIRGNNSGVTAANGNVSISGGTLNGNYSVHCQSDTKLTISGGTFNSDSMGVVAVGAANASITGGTINSGSDGVSFMNVSEAIITGGRFTGARFGVYSFNSTVTITDGTIYGSDTGVVADMGSKLSVTGGSITGEQSGVLVNESELSITGGSFSHDPSNWVAEGYKAKWNSETELYDVVKGYKVEIEQPEDGKVETDNDYPAPGDDVTVTVTPDEGKKVADVIVKDENGNEIPVTKNEDGSYTYEQPAGDVTVEVTFKDIPSSDDDDDYEPTYRPSIEKTEGGDTTVSNKNPTKGDKVTITTEPDKGYVVGKITITDKNGKPVAVIDNGDGTFTYVQPSGKVTIEVEYVPAISGFTDVAEESYYYDAVNWAAANGITSGISATTFGPDNACTRAQMATFLWRAAGSPEPKGNSNPFTDVTADAYYAKAVQWAVEQGITAGTSATTFSPNGVCTRAQMATFIYRCEQTNGGGFAGAWMFLLPFTDAPEWAYEPIAWCYKEGITSGTSATTFGPDDPCTRAQMVTFLYRYFVK